MPEPPDSRHLFANERTLLAWLRTALALMGAGFAATVLLAPTAPRVVRILLGVPLIVLGGVAAVGGYRRWSVVEAVLRAGHQEIPRTRMPMVLTAGIVALGAAALLLSWLAS